VVAERLRSLIEAAPCSFRSATLGITASFGTVTRTPADSRAINSPDQLLNLADQCLYAAKQAGRNRVVAAQREGTTP